MKVKDGEAAEALYHPDIGHIDLVWGKAGTPKKNFNDGYGLAKIAKKHPEAVDGLQESLSGMKVVSRTSNRIKLESPDHFAVVRLEWDDKSKSWLLTAFQKGKSISARGRTDVPGN